MSALCLVGCGEFARNCIARLDAGEDPFIAQYLIERSRAVGLPWAYGGTPAVLSQYVKVGHGGPPEAREMVKARSRHIAGEGKLLNACKSGWFCSAAR